MSLATARRSDRQAAHRKFDVRRQWSLAERRQRADEGRRRCMQFVRLLGLSNVPAIH
jgi:hypothetical protein